MTRGKKARALRVDRSAEREALRRKERQRTMFTSIVVLLLVGIGGVLIYVSAQDPAADLAESPSESEGASESASEAPDNREVACGGTAPAQAGEEKKTYPKADQVLEDGKDYRAVMTTSCGKITIDLYEEEAPESVNSFVFLAQNGFFDGLEIFRNAASIGALQTGAGTNEATFDIGYKLKDELAKAKADGYPPGVLALANSGPNTAGSQIFFVYNDKFKLPPSYTVFGKADPAGIKVLQKIGAIPNVPPPPPPSPAPSELAGQPPQDTEKPSELIYIDSVEITTK